MYGRQGGDLGHVGAPLKGALQAQHDEVAEEEAEGLSVRWEEEWGHYDGKRDNGQRERGTRGEGGRSGGRVTGEGGREGVSE